MDTDDAWIVRRTGIRERRIAEANEFTSDLCMAAVGDMQARGGRLDGVDYVIACTSTPDYGFPSVATRLQHRLGLKNVGAIDVTAACAGFTYGLDVADALVNSGRARKVLVAAGETMSKVMDYQDRGTCILFGDGAGVVLVDAPEDAPPTLLARRATSDGALGKELFLTNLRSEIAGVVEPERYLRQNGRAVYEWAVTAVTNGVAEMLDAARLKRRRRRLVRAAQRERAHDRVDLQAHADPVRARADEPGVVRQHLGGVDPARARARGARRARPARRRGAAVRLRRRARRERTAAALVVREHACVALPPPRSRPPSSPR